MIDGITTRGAKISLEIDERYAPYKGLVITPAQIGCNIRGSVHKYHNNGEHNADDFTLSDFEETLTRLYEDIELNPDITVLNAFEFGVNIKLPTTPRRALNRLILHKSNAGIEKKEYKEFAYNEYILKLYKKTGVEHIRDDVLRVEIRVEKMRYIRDKKGIYVKTLSDLLDVQVWEQLENILIESVEECLFIDLTDEEINGLPDNLQKDYHLYNNPRHWERLRDIGRMKYKRERDKCETFLNQYSTSTLKQDIVLLIRGKCCKLRDIPESRKKVRQWDKYHKVEKSQNVKSGYEITNLQDKPKQDLCYEITNLQNGEESKKCYEITNLQDNEKMPKCDEITIKIKCDFVTNTPEQCTTSPNQETAQKSGVKHAPISPSANVKTCLTCGRVISHPKKGQKYCSAKEVGYEAAHKCRNIASNPRNNTLRSIERVISIPMLFDLDETIDPAKRKYI